MNILSFTYPNVVPNLYDFLSSVEHEKNILKNVSVFFLFIQRKSMGSKTTPESGKKTHSAKESKSYMFIMKWGWANDRIFILGLTFPRRSLDNPTNSHWPSSLSPSICSGPPRVLCECAHVYTSWNMYLSIQHGGRSGVRGGLEREIWLNSSRSIRITAGLALWTTKNHNVNTEDKCMLGAYIRECVFFIKCLTGFWNSGCDGLHTLTQLCGDFTGLLWKTWAGQNSEIQWATWTVSWNKKTIVFPFPMRVFFSLGLLNSLTTNLWDCFSFKERCYALFTNVASPSW